MAQFTVGTSKDSRGVTIVTIQPSTYGVVELLTTEAEALIKQLQSAVNGARSANAPKKRIGDY